ncbi:MAG TPA: response regulator [Candidatus Acidoferrales bacterium]|nr:response regulator [Candidatus Acidoferrales bacterium]
MARKILLADDSVTAQNMGRKILADAGYEVVTVNNGSAALKKIAELKPDLVILDVYMPGYSGLEVCQRLKESPDSARIPVLLTVGKLEPFKPEEARRVRAEGFIVKPFEASELLAALSKLEDKVVPRAEPSKPGRFARAIAAAEESGRISRNEASGEDNGWKSRISFPHEKAAQDKGADDDTIYNPVNRDLRTVVEPVAQKAAERQQEQLQRAAEASVDLSALAATGLPQDVTPEEVAAIAAAAAQIHLVAATIEEEHRISVAESSATRNSVEQERAHDAAAEIQAGTAPLVNAETQVEAVTETKESTASETGADQTGLRRDTEDKSCEAQDVPVTMAAATESTAAANGSATRWTAVAVALEGEEATLSLEQEMHKAYSAFVAEETSSAKLAALADAAPSTDVPASAEAGGVAPASGPVDSDPALQPQHVMPAEAAESEPQSDAPATGSFVEGAPAGGSESSASIPQPEAALLAPEVASVQPPAESSPEFAEPNHEVVSDPVSSAQTGPASELPPVPGSEPALAEMSPSSDTVAQLVRSEFSEEHREEPKEESETVKSTAAAWASWRHTRDTSETKPVPAEPEHREFNAPTAPAAMAVAAGAEQTAQETAPPSENPTDVASIVDSVLADLRPRLMAEITRKMAEKK